MAIFYISHRLQVLKKISDRIYILENGKIQDHGNHEELLSKQNIYSSFWQDIN